ALASTRLLCLYFTPHKLAWNKDRSFRGDRALTRYEFAAGLNACLDVVLQLDGPGPNLSEMGRLEREFAAELQAISARVEPLEADVAELQANQFSTTTKFSGQVFTHLNYTTASGDISAEGSNAFGGGRDPVTLEPTVRTVTEDPEPIFTYLTWLNFTTSFTGQDRLVLQLAAGDGSAGANAFVSAGLFNTYGTPFTLSRVQQDDEPVVRELFYSFPVGDKLSFTIGPRVNWYRYFDNNRFTFFLTGANSFNASGSTQANAVDRGAGVVAEWDIANWLDLRLGYLAENTEFLPGPRSSSDPSRGLFGGANTLTGQVGIYPTDNLNLRFLYTRSNLEANDFGIVGGAVAEPLQGLADDGFGGPLRTATADTFLFNFDWLLTEGFGLFGRYSYGSTHLFPVSDEREDGDVNAQSVQIGTAFPNLFKQGALATISYLQPFEVLDGENFLVSGGGDGGVQKEVEVSYRYPINSNFALVPSVYWIMDANNFSDNSDIFVFNLQTQISF
ncbi:MAG: iron uptake porin, partial [Phormidesmis sp.]